MIDEAFVKVMLLVVAMPLLMSLVAESFLFILREDVGRDIRDFLNRVGVRAGINKKTH
tara:strand:+ start:227 stop:400 length:174 start_codon:yes stop_codon:yes gene_type:complete